MRTALLLLLLTAPALASCGAKEPQPASSFAAGWESVTGGR